MLLFRSDPFGGTHELLPCGLLGGDLVKLFRKNNSKYYWYDFMVRGERYRGSTKETNETRAQKAAALKLAATIKGSDPLDRKPPTLREYSKDFLQWADTETARVRHPPLLQKRLATVGTGEDCRNAHGPDRQRRGRKTAVARVGLERQ
jgi:hypothetical protein